MLENDLNYKEKRCMKKCVWTTCAALFFGIAGFIGAAFILLSSFSLYSRSGIERFTQEKFGNVRI